jgi:hypothetical protein
MVMSPHALIPSATPFGLENVKLLRRKERLVRAFRRGWLTPAAVACVAALLVFFSVIAPKEIRRTSTFK